VSAEVTDHVGRPLHVGDRVRQVGYWHGGRLADVGRAGVITDFTRQGRAEVSLDGMTESRRLGGVILRRLDDQHEPVEPEEAEE
jgi:hypothetical protein